MQRAVVVLVAILAGFLASCGAGTATSTPEGRAASAVEQRYPALRWVPASATYMVVSARTADALSATRELVMALGILADFDMAAMDAELQVEIGFNPLSADALADAGVALDRGAAVFSDAILPTFVLPVADEARLDQFLDRHRPAGAVQVRRHGDRDWWSWRDGDMAVQWTRWPGHVAVHLAMGAGIADPGWLDSMQATPRMSEHADLGWAIDQVQQARAAAPATSGEHPPGPGMPDVIGLMRPDAFAGAVRALEVKTRPKADADADARAEAEAEAEARARIEPCWRMLRPLPGPIALGIGVDWDHAEGVVVARLSRHASDALRRQASAPPPGFSRYRQQTGFHGSAAVDPRWLAEILAATGCEPAVELAGELSALARYGVAALYLAIERLDIGQLTGRGAVHLALRDRGAGAALLELIPRRPLFERTVTLAGRAVTVVEVPLVISLAYLLDDRGLTAAVDREVMEQVLADWREPAAAGRRHGDAPPVELASLAISPPRLGNLAELMQSLASAGYLGEAFATRSVQRLARYDHGALTLAVHGDSLVLHGAMRLGR